jgi:AhpD family alkylhydroperoxidase
MPRLDYLDENELSPDARELLRVAEAAGSPDPRVLKILFKSPIGVAWYRYWLASSNEGQLPKDLKELCRVKIAFDHECGYCGTVRSAAAKAAGLTEQKIQEVWNFEASEMLSDREKTALRFADYMRHDISKADDDAFYAQLKQHFSDAEIVELGLWCAENVGAGSFVRTLKLVSWEDACRLNPDTAKHAAAAGRR